MRRKLQLDPIQLSTAGGLAAVMLWSTTVAFARSLSEQIGPVTAGAVVYLVGGTLCLARLGWKKAWLDPLRKASWLYLGGCGFLFAAYAALLFGAVGLARDRQQTLEIGLINYLWPTLTILFSLLLLNQRAGRGLGWGTGLALAGIFLVMTQGERLAWSTFWGNLKGHPAPYGLALLAAIAWALYSNLARRWSAPESSGAVEWFIPATGLILLAMRGMIPEPADWSSGTVLEAAFLGACTVLAYGFWDRAMRRGHMLGVVIFSYFTPLFSTLVTCLYLGIMPGPRLWAGCVLLVAGSWLTQRSVRDQGPVHPAVEDARS